MRINLPAFSLAKMNSWAAKGTPPTVTGCGTISSQVGGALSGTFVTSATSCTPVLTAMPTQANGYNCTIVDRTTGTGVNYMNIASSVTSATFPTFTTVATNVLGFTCTGY